MAALPPLLRDAIIVWPISRARPAPVTTCRVVRARGWLRFSFRSSPPHTRSTPAVSGLVGVVLAVLAVARARRRLGWLVGRSWLGGSLGQVRAPAPRPPNFCEAVVFVNGMAAGFLGCGRRPLLVRPGGEPLGVLALQLTLTASFHGERVRQSVVLPPPAPCHCRTVGTARVLLPSLASLYALALSPVYCSYWYIPPANSGC
jgi:hypothetical protein